MIYKYNELVKKYGNKYQVSKAIADKKIFKLEKGLYSDDKYSSELEIITKKYPNAIFTMDSAFYFYDLTNVIPRKYQLAINFKKRKIEDDKIELFYTSESFFEVGKTTLETHNTIINIYDKERMLIELVRNKNKIPFDFYKEILNNYRELTDSLDESKIEEYLNYFKNKDNIFEIIRNEVY